MALLSYWHIFGFFLINEQSHAISCFFQTGEFVAD